LKFAILFLDLDDFKLVNDCLGHSSGDEVLVSFANKFKNIVRSNDMVARVGGDEFIIVLSDISNYLFVERVCNKILSILSKPMKISDIEFNLGVSIGVAVYPDNGEDIDRLISNADSAMYHAKENGKNNFEFYSEEMNKKLVEFSQREKELLDAIRNDEFIIHFQPEIDTHTNEVFSLEVLTRWNNKAKGLLLPGHFISDLESTNYIFEFEELIIEKACKQLKIWHDTNIYKGTISVNITGKYLEYGNLYESIGNILVRTGLSAKFLELEFNESDVMKISTKTLFTLSNLSHLGVGLAIDNFGKGFSSFNYLKECSISRLKIDKSYVDSLMDEKNDESIIKSIVDIGTNMGISVIAEGIEVTEQDEIIKKNSCTKVQGYFYAKPMDADIFEFWYKNYKKLNLTL
jgi:diguanylate cyclase (GGDEF)-like protein